MRIKASLKPIKLISKGHGNDYSMMKIVGGAVMTCFRVYGLHHLFQEQRLPPSS